MYQVDEHRLKGELDYAITTARADYYRYSFGQEYGNFDRFDGLPNFDDARGAEVALRAIASRLGVKVVDEEEARSSGVLTLEHQIAEAGEVQSDELVEYLRAVRLGEVTGPLGEGA